MAREPLPERRRTWRQKVVIMDATGGANTFYVDFGEYADGRLAEIFVTASKCGTFLRGVLDSLSRAVSVAMQSGTAPHTMAEQLCGQDYPPQGRVEAEGSAVAQCKSIADYIGQEILNSYDQDGKRRT